MAIWRARGGWRARVQFKGKTHYAPGIFRYKEEAREWVKNTKIELKADQDITATSSYLLYEATGRYLDHVRVRNTRGTYTEKLACLKRFLAFVGDKPLEDVTPHDVQQYLDYRAVELSNYASNRDRRNIKAFFTWAREFLGVMHDPTAPTRNLPHSPKAKRLIPVEDIKRVILAAPMPERALIACYWHTGARRSEILRLRWDEDINFENRTIRLGTRKTRGGATRYDYLPINDKLLRYLKALWKSRDRASPYLFPQYYVLGRYGENKTGEQRANRLLKRLCKEAGVEPFGFHDIRHSVAVYLNDVQKVGMKTVQRILRHQRQTTTERYIEGSYSDLEGALSLLAATKVEGEMSPKTSPKQALEDASCGLTA